MIVHCPIFFPFTPHVNEQKQKNISISVQYLAISCHLTLYNNTFKFLTISNNILHFLTDRNTYKCYTIVKVCGITMLMEKYLGCFPFCCLNHKKWVHSWFHVYDEPGIQRVPCSDSLGLNYIMMRVSILRRIPVILLCYSNIGLEQIFHWDLTTITYIYQKNCAGYSYVPVPFFFGCIKWNKVYICCHGNSPFYSLFLFEWKYLTSFSKQFIIEFINLMKKMKVKHGDHSLFFLLYQ